MLGHILMIASSIAAAVNSNFSPLLSPYALLSMLEAIVQ